MNEERLREIEALCEVATPGPWIPTGYVMQDVRQDLPVVEDDYQPEVLVTDGGLYWYSSHERARQLGTPKDADLNFVCASRTALPEAIADVRRLRGLISEAMKQKFMTNPCPWCRAPLDSIDDEHAADCPACLPNGEVR